MDHPLSVPEVSLRWEDNQDVYPPYRDGDPLESAWHLDAMILLLDVIDHHCQGRPDYYASGDIRFQFSPDRQRAEDFRGPDFLFVTGVERYRRRQTWTVWEENGRVPDVVIELSSPSTAQVDRRAKFEAYEQVARVPEYFIFDPRFGHPEGWRLASMADSEPRYVPVEPNGESRLWSEGLQLWLGSWRGTYRATTDVFLRFFTAEGRLAPTTREFAEDQTRRAEAAEAELERLRRGTPPV